MYVTERNERELLTRRGELQATNDEIYQAELDWERYMRSSISTANSVEGIFKEHLPTMQRYMGEDFKLGVNYATFENLRSAEERVAKGQKLSPYHETALNYRNQLDAQIDALKQAYPDDPDVQNIPTWAQAVAGVPDFQKRVYERKQEVESRSIGGFWQRAGAGVVGTINDPLQLGQILVTAPLSATTILGTIALEGGLAMLGEAVTQEMAEDRFRAVGMTDDQISSEFWTNVAGAGITAGAFGGAFAGVSRLAARALGGGPVQKLDPNFNAGELQADARRAVDFQNVQQADERVAYLFGDGWEDFSQRLPASLRADATLVRDAYRDIIKNNPIAEKSWPAIVEHTQRADAAMRAVIEGETSPALTRPTQRMVNEQIDPISNIRVTVDRIVNGEATLDALKPMLSKQEWDELNVQLEMGKAVADPDALRNAVRSTITSRYANQLRVSVAPSEADAAEARLIRSLRRMAGEPIPDEAFDADAVRTAQLQAKASQPATKVVDGQDVPDPEVFAARRELAQREAAKQQAESAQVPDGQIKPVESVLERDVTWEDVKRMRDEANTPENYELIHTDPALKQLMKQIEDDVEAAKLIADCKGA